jgi:coenzyme F420 biosynthesis associated uncharacterized protein
MSRIPWPLAERVAGRLAGEYPLEGTYHMELLARQAPDLVERAGELVSEETGLSGFGHPRVEVVTRRQWARANISFISTLLGPAEEQLLRRFGDGGVIRTAASGLSRRMMAIEMGTLLCVLARKVLGQYELVLPPSDQNRGDTILIVGANVLNLERIHQFRPTDFRLWIALHEATHRLQLVGVPWLQAYFLDLVQQLMASAKPEPGKVQRLVTELREAANEGRPVLDESGLFGLLASKPQRELMNRVQALMSLLEGHGHVVMDRVGARIFKGQARMSRILKARRDDPRMRAFLRITGLEMKLRQYELGESFVRGVEQEAGWYAIDMAWQGPEYLPTRDEIEDPRAWLARVA